LSFAAGAMVLVSHRQSTMWIADTAYSVEKDVKTGRRIS